MRIILVGFIIVMCFTLVACEEPTNEEIFYKIQKNFNEIESYECMAEIIISEDKTSNNLKAKHIFQRPNKYIIEMIEPIESEGFITKFDGNNAWLHHPQINQSILIKDFKDSGQESMFIGYFLKLSLTGEDLMLGTDNIKGKDYITATTTIPGNNKYRNSEKIWIDKETSNPYKLLILDSEGDISIEVFFSKFKKNIKINEDLFQIKKNLQ